MVLSTLLEISGKYGQQYNWKTKRGRVPATVHLSTPSVTGAATLATASTLSKTSMSSANRRVVTAVVCVTLIYTVLENSFMVTSVVLVCLVELMLLPL